MKLKNGLLMKKGFTLAEVLITLAVVGVLASLLIPSLKGLTPDKNKVMFKKAYSTLENVISTLVSDETYYPSSETGTNTDDSTTVSKGFNFTLKDSTPSYYTSNKFCYLLTNALNTLGTVTCPAYSAYSDAYFTTSDGIVWSIDYPASGTDSAPDTQFPLSYSSYSTRIVFDVDGASTGDNCSTDSAAASYTFNGTALTRCSYYSTCTKASDRYIVGVRYDGKLQVGSGASTDTCAIGILSNPTTNTK